MWVCEKASFERKEKTANAVVLGCSAFLVPKSGSVGSPLRLVARSNALRTPGVLGLPEVVLCGPLVADAPDGLLAEEMRLLCVGRYILCAGPSPGVILCVDL